MTQTLTLEPFAGMPEDIDAELQRLLQLPPQVKIGEWLYELIRSSGHLSTSDDIRWRLLCIIWLAFEYDLERAWPYLMWLNMNQAVMSDHLTEILTEALDDYSSHLRLARWLAENKEARLQTFFSQFQNLPASHKMGDTFAYLINHPERPELKPWLANFCRQTVGQVSPYIRPWHLFAATWYATCFEPAEGLTYLNAFSDNAEILSAPANQTLKELAGQLHCLPTIIQWIANCPDPAVKTMLKDFARLDLAAFTETIFKKEPDYTHLAGAATQAPQDARIFERNLAIVEQAGAAKSSPILELACGPLAAQTLLFHTAGYNISGVGQDIPPAYLPLSGLRQRFKRGQYIKAWQAATTPYYQALARETGMQLRWRKLQIQLADLAHLAVADQSVMVVICCQYLQHAPDVEGLLAAVARVLKPGGLFLADIKPYPAFAGAFMPTPTAPWQHLRPLSEPVPSSPLILNKWRESQYQTALEKYFTLESWLTEQDERATPHLTPNIEAELADYSAAELTRGEVVIVARKL